MGVAYYNENDPFMVEWLRELIKQKLIAPGVDAGRSGDWNSDAGTDDQRPRLADSPRSRTNKVRWDKADWLRCRDGYYRPVEPGTFPLVDGLPGRVGRVRGYGNAIVPEVASTFIICFMEALEW